MASTFTKIASYTVSSAVTSFQMNSIPQTYTDLCIKISGRGSRSAFYSDATVRINNDGSLLYDWRWLRDYSGTVGSYSATNDYGISWYDNGSTSTSNVFSNTEIYIPNYTSSNYKSVSFENIVETNSTDCFVLLGTYLYKSTNAITSLGFTGSPNNYSLQPYSTYTLYGIKNS